MLCRDSCGRTLNCLTSCDESLFTCTDSCPCYADCPDGCKDCDNKICKRTAILVLNTNLFGSSAPQLIDIFGNSKVANFEFLEDTDAAIACGLTFQNEMWIYGGQREPRQISKVVGCSLERVGSLLFDHFLGACAVGGDFVYLCFNYDNNDYKRCRRSRNPERNFEQIRKSNHEHISTRMAASNGKLGTDLLIYCH